MKKTAPYLLILIIAGFLCQDTIRTKNYISPTSSVTKVTANDNQLSGTEPSLAQDINKLLSTVKLCLVSYLSLILVISIAILIIAYIQHKRGKPLWV